MLLALLATLLAPSPADAQTSLAFAGPRVERDANSNPFAMGVASTERPSEAPTLAIEGATEFRPESADDGVPVVPSLRGQYALRFLPASERAQLNLNVRLSLQAPPVSAAAEDIARRTFASESTGNANLDLQFQYRDQVGGPQGDQIGGPQGTPYQVTFAVSGALEVQHASEVQPMCVINQGGEEICIDTAVGQTFGMARATALAALTFGPVTLAVRGGWAGGWGDLSEELAEAIDIRPFFQGQLWFHVRNEFIVASVSIIEGLEPTFTIGIATTFAPFGQTVENGARQDGNGSLQSVEASTRREEEEDAAQPARAAEPATPAAPAAAESPAPVEPVVDRVTPEESP